MNTHTTRKIATAVLPIICALAFATPTFATTTPKVVHPTAQTAAKNTAKTTTPSAAKVSKTETEIDSRVSALTALENRITTMTRVSQDVKNQLTTTIQSTIASLGALKTKLSTDTAAELKADTLTMTAGTRVYALVVPQVRILAAADRANTVADMLTNVDAKLKTRLSDATTAGKDVTALATAETDMEAKISDANTQIQAVLSGVSNLTPDGGDKTKLASNTLALKTARTALKTAEQDLTAAQKDSKTIVNGLKAMEGAKTQTETTTTH